MPPFIDLTKQKFNRLSVIKNMGKNKWGKYKWLCRCDCGKEKIIQSGSLRSGYTKSCGCLHREIASRVNKKHGHNVGAKKSKAYTSWANMHARCLNPNDKRYDDYGGRGIIVCKRWRKFTNFLEDMGEKPKGLQIDRINNNGNYCKSNCRWATRSQQMRNTRRNCLITFNSKTQCLVDWAEETGISKHTIKYRLNNGWSVKKALTTPVGKQNK